MYKLFVISVLLAAAAAEPEAKPYVGGSLSSLPQHTVGVLPQAPVAIGPHLPLDVPFGHIGIPASPIDLSASLPVGVRTHLPVEFGAYPAHFPAAVRTYETPALFRAAEPVAFPVARHFEDVVHHGPVLREPVVGYPAVRHF